MAEKLIFNPETGELIAEAKAISAVKLRNRVTASVKKAKDQRKGGIPEFIKSLTPAIKDAFEKGSVLVRLETLGMLRSSGAKYNAFAGLVAQRLEDPSKEVRLAAVETLKSIGYHDYAHKTFQRLLKSEESETRLFALKGINACGASARVEISEVMNLFEDKVLNVREAAYEAFSSCGFPRQLLAKVEYYIRHQDADVRLRLMKALELCGESAIMAMPLMVMRLDDPDQRVRDETARILKRMHYHPIAHQAWLRMLRHSKEARRLVALKVLAESSSKARPLSPEVLKCCSDFSMDVQREALRVISLTGMNRDCFRTLDNLRYHPQLNTRMKVMDILEMFAGDLIEGAFPLAVSMLTDKEFPIRERAFLYIKRVGFHPTGIAEFQKVLRHDDPEIRELGLLLMEGFKEDIRGLILPIMQRLEDGKSHLAEKAMAILCRQGIVSEGLGILERMLKSRDQDRKLRALEVLKTSGLSGVKALGWIIPLLGDPAIVVREAALDSFIAIGFHEECLPEVKKVIAHQDREYRLMMIKALGACGMSASAAKDYLNTCIEDQDIEIERAARAALKAIQS